MNVGIVVHHFDAADGTGGYVVNLLPYLAQHHSITVYAAAFRAPLPDNVQAVRVPAVRGRAYATILSFPAAFARVRQRHDLVHAQGWVALRAHVVTAHIILRAWREAARRAGVRPPWGERVFGRFVERREAALYGAGCRRVIAPSHKIRGELAHYYGRIEGTDVVPHGFPSGTAVRDRALARSSFGVRNASCVTLYVGDARKGLRCALEAVASVPGVELLVVGYSSTGPYRRRAQALGIDDRVHWVGPLSDMEPAYAAADVLLHPTIYDAFGLVVAEAMAAGVPPIVPRTAGVSELIADRVSGWVTETPELVETTAALATLARDPDLRRRLGAGARSTSASRTWETVARETLAVYEGAVGA